MIKVWNGCVKCIYAVLFTVLILLSAYIFYGALDTLDGADALQEVLHGKMVPVFLLGTSFLLGFLLLGLFRRLIPILEKHEKKAVPVLFGVMVFLQVLTVICVRTSLRYDHLKIFDTAISLLEQGVISDTHFSSYFMKYPNNIPICLFTYFWLRLAELFRIPREVWMEYIKLVNLLFMNFGMWCGYRILRRHQSASAALRYLMLILVNPLWYLLGEMYYTSTISLAFSMGAIWLFDSAGRQETLWKKYTQYALAGILLAAGYQIRATVIITAAALLIYAVLRIRSFRRSREAFSVLAVLFGAVLMLGAYKTAERHYAGFDPSQTGYPAVHWVMMSAQGEGQYNSADDAYTGSFSTKEERTRADLDRLKERLEQMGPGGLLTLFRNKLRVAFSDGDDDYASLFQTMREASPVQKYINGSRSDYLAVYLHSYHSLLCGLILLALVWRAFRGKRGFLDVIALNVCGAYLFYLIWEVDEAYSIPFMLMLLMLEAAGMEKLDGGFAKAREKLPALRHAPAAAACGLLMIAAGLVWVVSRTGAPVRNYSVLQDQETSKDLLLQTEFSQTFRTGKAFDHIDLWVANWDGAANDSIYELRILDEAGTEVARAQMPGAQMPCIDAYTVAFEKVIPEREQTYTIQVSLSNPDCAVKTDFLYYGTGAWDMYGDGALYAPEEIPNVDLAFAVYEER
ncbi:MAG TPA: glycosyltransferase family 39 protein [Candidatus Choladocola avistercoris]|nr:glycosyltransferase family 39 protein [Candidatus Choladocola avistercoris]